MNKITKNQNSYKKKKKSYKKNSDVGLGCSNRTKLDHNQRRDAHSIEWRLTIEIATRLNNIERSRQKADESISFELFFFSFNYFDNSLLEIFPVDSIELLTDGLLQKKMK